MKIAVIGGSIAGLATAVRLQKSGHHVTVWEKRHSSHQGGYGMILKSSSVNLLKKLGVSADLCTQPIQSYLAHDCESGLVHRENIDLCHGVERSQITQKLQALLKPGTLHFEEEFDHFEFPNDLSIANRAVFLSGKKIEADMFIAADGIRSKVRETYFIDSALSPVKTVELVGFSSFNALPTELNNCFRKYLHPSQGAAMGMVPTSDQKVVWYFQWDAKRWPQVFSKPEIRNAWLIKEVRSWPKLALEVIKKANLANTHLCRTTDKELPNQFHRGNIVLVGDAAHPLLTFTSQGVGSALEDALVLGDLIDKTSSTAEKELGQKMDTYAQLRLPVLKNRLLAGRELQNNFLNRDSQFSMTIPICA
ncbi:MAG: hypothetical protein CBC13_04395 [Planctomycetia bacterium TMED53]|nr:MAG: hypothetical protein CBC13_04395 [Planctomycetia bacterium TMED53]